MSEDGALDLGLSDLEFEPRVLVRPKYDVTGEVTDFTYVALNAAAARALGVAPDDVIGRDALASDARMGRSRFFAHLQRAARAEGPIAVDHERDVDHRTGEPITYDLRAARRDELLEASWRNLTETMELQDSYRLLAEYVSDVVFRGGIDFTLTWVSPSVYVMLGWSPLDLVGRDVTELLHPEDAVHVQTWLEQLSTSRRLQVEVRLRHADGHFSHFAARLALVDNDGSSGVVGILRDVEEEVRTRQSLEQLSERYRLVAQHATDVVVRAGVDNRIAWVFDSVTGLLGWKPDELEGHLFDELVHPDDARQIEAVRRVIARGGRGHAEIRLRHRQGDYRWIAITVQEITDAPGQAPIRLAWWRDIEAEVRQRANTAAAESRYRLLAENASDIVWQFDGNEVITWVSPSVETVLGWRPTDLVGRPVAELHRVEDLESRARAHAATLLGDVVPPFEGRLRTASGGLRWMRAHYRALREDGHVTGVVVGLQDLEATIRSRRAAAALAAGNAILVRATNERTLLADLCQSLVDTTGYVLAWYGRPVEGPERLVVPTASSTRLRDYVEGITVTWDEGPNGRGPTGTAVRTGQPQVFNDFAGDPRFVRWAERAAAFGLAASVALPVRVAGAVDGVFTVYSDVAGTFDDESVDLLASLAAQVGIGLERLRERDRLAGTLQEALLLRTAIDHAAEAVIVTDRAARILYANRAASDFTGYSPAEILGQNPRLWKSELQDEDFYRTLWAELAAGRPWRGHLINRAKGGELYEVDAVISPVVTEDGAPLAYVGVERNVTEERRLATDNERLERDAAQLATLMGESRTSYDVPTSATELCGQLVDLDFVDLVALYRRNADGRFTLAAVAGDEPITAVARELAPILPASWVDMITARPRARRVDLTDAAAHGNDPLFVTLVDHDFALAVLVPMRWNNRTIGALAIAVHTDSGPAVARTRTSVFDELGSFAGSQLGPQIDREERHEILRHGVEEVLAHQRFHPVFQPIVDLPSGEVRGYEALTRFDDGRPPDEHFAEAAAAHLSAEIERACVERALAEASTLPASTLVTLNLSPLTLLAPATLDLLEGAGRAIGIELTEHSAISDYGALRLALDRLADVRLLVDDAGAGYASLRHILELHPDVVKLDISLVRGIDHDEAKQALVAGMRRFADRTRMQLLAEGVETEAESAACRELGVDLAQGYHFGRPQAIAALAPRHSAP